jgi:hypothetical protein
VLVHGAGEDGVFESGGALLDAVQYLLHEIRLAVQDGVKDTKDPSAERQSRALDQLDGGGHAARGA